jgi:hypothetical protein
MLVGSGQPKLQAWRERDKQELKASLKPARMRQDGDWLLARRESPSFRMTINSLAVQLAFMLAWFAGPTA